MQARSKGSKQPLIRQGAGNVATGHQGYTHSHTRRKKGMYGRARALGPSWVPLKTSLGHSCCRKLSEGHLQKHNPKTKSLKHISKLLLSLAHTI